MDQPLSLALRTETASAHDDAEGSAFVEQLMGGLACRPAFVALVAANFAYLYPILTDTLLPYPAWLSRMWFRSWI